MQHPNCITSGPFEFLDKLVQADKGFPRHPERRSPAAGQVFECGSFVGQKVLGDNPARARSTCIPSASKILTSASLPIRS